MALSLVSSSLRVRCVAASSERICARDEGDARSAGVGEALPFGVAGRIVLVEAVGVVVSSAADVGRFARFAVRSASLVSYHNKHIGSPNA